MPLIENVAGLKDAARDRGQGQLRLLLAEQERSTTLRAAMEMAIEESVDRRPPVHLAMGPEGGWTAEEESLFAAEGWKPVSLGPRILRAETAGIAALAVVASLFD
jgi:16S rRNA (uracil1498-N3)-methyltransferase